MFLIAVAHSAMIVLLYPITFILHFTSLPNINLDIAVAHIKVLVKHQAQRGERSIENVDITRINPRGAKGISCHEIKHTRSIYLSRRWGLGFCCSYVLYTSHIRFI